ncbi:MAG: hypothetical protein ABIU54_06045 [Candidatus Eisenbacteria bacterium]
MYRLQVSGLVVCMALLGVPSVHAEPGVRTLVLPFRSLGVNDTTLAVARDLLIGDMQSHGMSIVSVDGENLAHGALACDAPECAAALARESNATQVVYGSLSRLSTKVIARLSVLRVGEPAPFYRDQITATTEEDLDAVMRRIAEGIAAGKPNSNQASVESVTQAETTAPARRATRTGFGLRAGFLFPTGNGFGGADRLTNIHGAYRYEFGRTQIESSTLVGLSWGDGNLDWTLLDLTAARLFGTRDIATYVGAGIGVHTITVERRLPFNGSGTGPYGPSTQTETVPTLDLAAGLVALRTYDFNAILEPRFHLVFSNFDEVGGDGANGVMLTFGTSP